MKRIINSHEVELRNGKFWLHGKHKFLKIGKPLLDYSNADQIESLIADLSVLKGKGYDCLELNCYWFHLDPDGDGQIEVSLAPLNKLIGAISDHGMFACLSVETYGVGGGQIPAGFWKRYPDSVAINSKGERVQDDEYGFMSAVPSLFDPDFLRVSRDYIRNLVRGLDASKILWYETTVEPQYMGAQWLDYSASAKNAYLTWLEVNKIQGPAFPSVFPVSEEFLLDPVWNRFRAEWLADWINGDAQAYRDVAGQEAWIAADYLDAAENTMTQRCGDPIIFLTRLTAPNILQVNWTWHNADRQPNLKAYQRVRQVMEKTGRDWAVTEHMTINGTDYYPNEMEQLLRNTISNSTHFGWEFVDVVPDRDDPNVPIGTVTPGRFKPVHFSVYGADWQPKPSMAVVDGQWEQWMQEIGKAAGTPVIA